MRGVAVDLMKGGQVVFWVPCWKPVGAQALLDLSALLLACFVLSDSSARLLAFLLLRMSAAYVGQYDYNGIATVAAFSESLVSMFHWPLGNRAFICQTI
jgi:hypothetical protein